MAEKLSPCCARAQYQIDMDMAELRRQTRIANARVAKGLSTTKVRDDIAKVKVELASHRQAQVDHDAQHAAEHAVAV